MFVRYRSERVPRVTDSHRDARRRQILDAARRCFLRDGFHATSMQDVLTEAELSAGAVYRYFPSKEAIVVAITSEALSYVTGAFEDQALDPATPPALDVVIGRLVARVEELAEADGLDRLVVQAWGEAMRSPVIAERLAAGVSSARERLAAIIAVHQERGTFSREVAPEAAARALASLIPGFILQRAILGDVDARGYQAAVRALLAGPDA